VTPVGGFESPLHPRGEIMKFILILIMLKAGSYYTQDVGPFYSMDECFEERERIVIKRGKPLINFQAICIPFLPEA